MGVIPARAGTTNKRELQPPPARGHPRSCGDHPFGDLLDTAVWGSSPLVRGPQLIDYIHANKLGVIPARAGTTQQTGTETPPVRGHPRSCGDHIDTKAERIDVEGSSPLVRGPRAAHGVVFTVDGVIPARAGTTSEYGLSSLVAGGHPRSCGDHLDVPR